MYSLKAIHYPKSLRYQLFIWLLILLLPLIFISAATSYWLANRYINQTYDETLYRTALALADQVSLEELGIQVTLPEVAKDLLEFDEDDDIYFRIIGPTGDLIPSHTTLPLPKSYPKKDQFIYYDTMLNAEKLRAVVYCLPTLAGFAPTNNNHVYVLVGETLKKRSLVANEVVLSMLLPQLLILILTGALLFFGIKRGLQPLDKLKAELSQRDINDLSPVNHSNTPNELQPLIGVLNNLLSRLNSAIAKQQRFVSDAAHQLKTPLAGLKTQSELALREIDTHKTAHALSKINQASENLAHLVNQLLSLSKAEPDSASSILFETIDLVRLAKEVSADWVPTALEKNIDLGFCSEADTASVQGNVALLRELMNNLIDNAIRYTPHDGKVTIGINKLNTSVIFYVQDNGIGVSEEDKTLVFERFYRVLGTQQNGSGLGLSIVKEIAERHKAIVSLISDDYNQGTIFTVSFSQA